MTATPAATCQNCGGVGDDRLGPVQTLSMDLKPQLDDGRAWLIRAGGDIVEDALLCGARHDVDGAEHVCVRELHCEKHGRRTAPADPSKEN